MRSKCLVFFGVFFVSCFISFELHAQSTNIEQRLVGTWVTVSIRESEGYTPRENRGITWTIRADGTFSFSNGSSGKWAIFSNKIVLVYADGELDGGGPKEIFITQDSRTLILLESNGWQYVYNKR
jgi:hypothetical protein